jgi:hypothetical protein
VDMAPKLSWGEWSFRKGGGPIEFRVAGDPETAVAAKFFFFLDDAKAATEEVVRKEFEPFVLEPAKVKGSVNRVGFIFLATPVVAGSKRLFAWIEARQKNGEDHRQEYEYLLKASQVDLTMTDGVTLKLT